MFRFQEINGELESASAIGDRCAGRAAHREPRGRGVNGSREGRGGEGGRDSLGGGAGEALGAPGRGGRPEAGAVQPQPRTDPPHVAATAPGETDSLPPPSHPRSQPRGREGGYDCMARGMEPCHRHTGSVGGEDEGVGVELPEALGGGLCVPTGADGGRPDAMAAGENGCPHQRTPRQ